MSSSRPSRSAALLGVALFVAPSLAQAQRSPSFRIAPGAAAACLDAIGSQAGVTIAGDAALMAGVRCNAVAGSMSVAEALRRALDGTAVSVFQVAPGLFRVVRRTERPPAALVRPAEPASPAEPVWPEIVVVANSPVLWRITKDGSEIIVIGTVAPMPSRMVWNTRRLSHYLQGARRLLIAPEPRAGLAIMRDWNPRDAAGLLLPRGRYLRTELPADLRDRFTGARTLAKQAESRYSGLRPAIAGMLLLDDWRREADLVTLEPGRRIEEMARREHVPVQRVDPASALPTLDELPKMSSQAEETCLARLISNIEAEAGRSGPQAKAWSRGDLATLRRSYLPPVTCSNDVPGDDARRDRAARDWMAAIETALGVRGRTVAVVDLSILLAPEGLVSRVKTLGADVAVLVP